MGVYGPDIFPRPAAALERQLCERLQLGGASSSTMDPTSFHRVPTSTMDPTSFHRVPTYHGMPPMPHFEPTLQRVVEEALSDWPSWNILARMSHSVQQARGRGVQVSMPPTSVVDPRGSRVLREEEVYYLNKKNLRFSRRKLFVKMFYIRGGVSASVRARARLPISSVSGRARCAREKKYPGVGFESN